MYFSRVGVLLILITSGILISSSKANEWMSNAAQESTSDFKERARIARNIVKDTRNSSPTKYEDTVIDSSTQTITEGTTERKRKEMKRTIETLKGLYAVRPRRTKQVYHRQLDPINNIINITETNFVKEVTETTSLTSIHRRLNTPIKSRNDTELEKPNEWIHTKNEDEPKLYEMEQHTTTDSEELEKEALERNTSTTPDSEELEKETLESNTGTTTDSEELEKEALENITSRIYSEELEKGALESTTPDSEELEKEALESNTSTTTDSEELKKEALESITSIIDSVLESITSIFESTTTNSGELEKEALESNTSTTPDSEELKKGALESTTPATEELEKGALESSTTTESEELEKEALKSSTTTESEELEKEALESTTTNSEELEKEALESNTSTTMDRTQGKVVMTQRMNNDKHTNKDDDNDVQKFDITIKEEITTQSMISNTTVIKQDNDTRIQQNVTSDSNTEEMTTPYYFEEIGETEEIGESTTQESYNTISSTATTQKKPKTIIVERIEDSNYAPKNDKNFLQYPSLRKIPPEKNSTNNYTTPTVANITRTSYRTREPSTWMTFLTTKKPIPVTSIPTVTSTTLATSTTTSNITSTDSNGQGTYNLDKLNSKTNRTKIIQKKSNLMYTNVTEETSPKDAAIQKLLKFMIESKSYNDSKSETKKFMNDDSMSKLLYDNELYKLTGDKNYNNTLDKSIAQLKKQ